MLAIKIERPVLLNPITSQSTHTLVLQRAAFNQHSPGSSVHSEGPWDTQCQCQWHRTLIPWLLCHNCELPKALQARRERRQAAVYVKLLHIT